MFPQSLAQCARAPHKHAAVPEIIAGGEKFLGALLVRLFGEAGDAKKLGVEFVAGFNVAVAGLGPRGLDAHDHDVVFFRRQFDGALQDLPELFLVADDVIGGNIPITARESSLSRRNAARPIAGAVLRGSGSTTTCPAGRPGSCRQISSPTNSLVMIQNDSRVLNGISRSTVVWIMVWVPSRASTCLASLRRLRGQKRVPLPPARITG